jgi:hypothetical protein
MSEATATADTAQSKEGMPESRAIETTNVSSIFWAFNDRTMHGIDTKNFVFPGTIVNSLSQVAVSICELDSNGIPFIGDANMSILNVAPRPDGSIDVRWSVDWPTDLRVRLNFIIVN